MAHNFGPLARAIFVMMSSMMRFPGGWVGGGGGVDVGVRVRRGIIPVTLISSRIMRFRSDR